ncbi:hypothetical protein V8B97DRAFT_1937068 [Scleroderma yunnanense]
MTNGFTPEYNNHTEGTMEPGVVLSQGSASLLKRLAGPSSTKAGLSTDQTEINRIIADASKGSKFYENEKRKDKELSEKISKILKRRDEALLGIDIRVVERQVDQIIEELEEQRDLSQIIVHVDMDAFYASVELLSDPSLIGKPFAVGGGVLCTASYEARKYGVRSGMAEFVAKKLCPDLIVVKLNFERYREMSEKCMEIFRRYDPNMCLAGCDEGYLNITKYCEDNLMDAEACVREMRTTVYNETQLTVSAGVAPNKMLAKISSDKNKPNGQFQLSSDRRSIINFMHDLSVRKVPGVGRVHERMLEAIGIKTCGDIFTHRGTLSLMDEQFGLRFLLRTYLGIASNVVQPCQRKDRKSMGAERTFRPLNDKLMILSKLEDVAAELAHDMAEGGWTGKTVTLKYKLDTYQVFTRAKSFDHWISQKDDLFATGKELLLPELPLTIRLIGLRMTKLNDLRTIEPMGGIKRFFTASSSSPRKKTKREIDTELLQEMAGVGSDEESMPNYYEMEDESEFPGAEDDDHVQGKDEVPSAKDIKPRPQKPPSTGKAISSSFLHREGPSSLEKDNHEISSARRVPTKLDSMTSSDTSLENHTCPVCGKYMVTDNPGLNAHIDFCLSKGAILEAQTAANRPRSRRASTTPTTKRKQS